MNPLPFQLLSQPTQPFLIPINFHLNNYIIKFLQQNFMFLFNIECLIYLIYRLLYGWGLGNEWLLWLGDGLKACFLKTQLLLLEKFLYYAN